MGTLSNNILASAPGHPFYKHVTSSLIPWSWNYIIPFVTVHYGSGQWFIGAMWDEYHEALHDEHSDVFRKEPLTRVMMDGREREGPGRWVFFNVGRGGTWDAWDHKFFMWFGNELIPLVVEHLLLVVLVAGFLIGATTWCCMRRRKAKGYSAVKTEEIEIA